MPAREILCTARRRYSLHRGVVAVGFALDIEVDQAVAAAERFFLTGAAAYRGMPVFRAGLAREKDQFLGAAALGIDIFDQFQADFIDTAQIVFGNLEFFQFSRRDGNVGLFKISGRAGLEAIIIFFFSA